MTRAEAIQALHAHCGTQTAVDLVNALQNDGRVSDNVIEPSECATCDIVAAAQALTPYCK